MEWVKIFVFIFALIYIIRFIIAVTIELFSTNATTIKAPKLYEITLITALSYIITFFIT
jgi:hypothetical protein